MMIRNNTNAITVKSALEPVARCVVEPLRGDESKPRIRIDWLGQPKSGDLYDVPFDTAPLVLRNTELEAEVSSLKRQLEDEKLHVKQVSTGLDKALAKMEPCEHQFHFFGDQKLRRCNWCNEIEMEVTVKKRSEAPSTAEKL